jgi:serine/threonine-protein kinase HipA
MILFFCGILTQIKDVDFTFQYDVNYGKKYPNQMITFTMPIRERLYSENRLFPFFEGLTPEG